MTIEHKLLHVASPRACNTQQTTHEPATPHATGKQQPSLKALARKALGRNTPCNTHATEAEKPCNKQGEKTPPFVAQIPAIRDRLLALAAAEGRDPALVNRLPIADLPEYAGMDDAKLKALLSMLSDDADREAGRVPTGDTAAILCRSCGPVWVHPAIARMLPVVGGWPRSLGCPWCFIRARGRAIPRPRVACADCRHRVADPINPQGWGGCAVGNDSATWPHRRHRCDDFRPTEGTP
jgi:hypothetical protein